MLALIWIAIIGFCIIMYVILDGFTLGTGIMMMFMKPGERDLATSMILPTWDGNQTWLVLGMASLYGAFPTAFSILLPIFYLPLLIMVVAVLSRGVAFEFRLKSKQAKHRWDILFISASLIATLMQGFILGNFIQGFMVQNNQWYATSYFDLFSIIASFALVVGYGLLGSTRLILKTTKTLQTKMFRVSFILALLLMLFIFIISVYTPFVYPLVQHRWFNLTYIPYLAILPFFTVVFFILLILGLYKKWDRVPYWSAVILFLCPYFGFLISIYPYVIPYKMTIWQAASPNNTLQFILVGALIMLPVLLVYTGYSYKIFGGKVDEVIHY
jgi:cytochrome d ubiquinol oxidase subunit II